MSLSGSTVNLFVIYGTSIGRARFEFILPLLIVAGVAVSGEVVSVSAWSTWMDPALSGMVVHPAPPMRRTLEGLGRRLPGGWPYKRIGAASVASMMFWFMLVVILRVLGAHGLPLCVGYRVGTLLHQSTNGQPIVQAWLDALHGHAWT